jgi:hypothetical protein
MKPACANAWLEGAKAHAAHARTCPDCGASRPSAGGDLSALAGAAKAELTRAPKAKPWWAEALPAGLLNLVIALLVAVFWHGEAFAPGAAGLGWFGGGLALGLALIGVPWALAPGRRGARVLAPMLAVVALALVFGGNGGLVDPHLLAGWRCGLTETLASVLPVAVAFWALGEASFSWMRSLLAFASATAAGLFALATFCPDGAAMHLALFHVGPALILCLLATAVRARVPPRSFAP